MSIHQHPSDEVRAAFVRLADELCQWERATGRQSVLILKTEDGTYERLMSGKPVDSNISDEQLLGLINI